MFAGKRVSISASKKSHLRKLMVNKKGVEMMKNRNLFCVVLMGMQTIGMSGCFTALNKNPVLGSP